MASPKWRRIRCEALERAGHTCAVCNSPHRLRVHHKHYRTLGDERPEDLTVLCHPCHVLADQARRRVAGNVRFSSKRRKRTKRRRLSRGLRGIRTVAVVLATGYAGLKLASIVLPALS